MIRKIGNFLRYNGFDGTIEITDYGILVGTVIGSNPVQEYLAMNIESLEIAFHEAVDEYKLNSLYFKDIKCSPNLIKNCKLNCEKCGCSECPERNTCEYGQSFFGCGKYVL